MGAIRLVGGLPPGHAELELLRVLTTPRGD
jgi:hypothetical protein